MEILLNPCGRVTVTSLVGRCTTVSLSTHSVQHLELRRLTDLATTATSGKCTASTNEDPLGPTSPNQTRFPISQCMNSRPLDWALLCKGSSQRCWHLKRSLKTVSNALSSLAAVESLKNAPQIRSERIVYTPHMNHLIHDVQERKQAELK
jgi:hypothetical protein